MDNKQYSKGNMGKGLETFLIISQLWYQESTYNRLFLTFPAEHSSQVFLIIFQIEEYSLFDTQIFFVS